MPKKKIIYHDEPVSKRPHRNMVSINLPIELFMLL